MNRGPDAMYRAHLEFFIVRSEITCKESIKRKQAANFRHALDRPRVSFSFGGTLMKAIVSMLALVVALVSVPGFALDAALHKRVTVDYRKVSVDKVLKDLEGKAGIRFECSEKLLKGLSPVNFTSTNQQAGRVATRILRPRGLKLELDRKGGEDVTVVEVDPLDEFKVKREEVYEFTSKPKVTREGDRITIEFATKGWCDVTVAIEQGAGGKIFRHLASGVLGENAPEPFLWNSRRQVLVWDGKDDQGRYVRDMDAITVRVSLGLKPQFERTLFWSPQKRLGVGSRPLLAASPEGVYIYEGEGLDMLKLFDHDGNYVKTIYPFPSNTLKDVKGLAWQKLPQSGQSMPAKKGIHHHSTLLRSGSNLSEDRRGAAGTALAVSGSRIALAGVKLSRLSSDGTSGGMDLLGPRTSFPYRQRSRKNVAVSPRSMAFSPDGKQLYFTGFVADGGTFANDSLWFLHGVARINFGAKGNVAPSAFVGEFDGKGAGNGPNQFNAPTSVACDAKGRVYVTDYMNDRVQVFTPDGKNIKSLKIAKPAVIQIHHKSQDLYIFSHWIFVRNRNGGEAMKATLTHLGPLENPKKIAEYPLPLNGHDQKGGYYGRYVGLHYGMVLDSYTQPPTIWLVPNKAGIVDQEWVRRGFGGTDAIAQAGQIKLLVERPKALETKRDFGKEIAATVKRLRAPADSRQRLFVNPATQKLYVWEGDSGEKNKACKQLVEIDPESGLVNKMDLPFTTEDLVFGPDGLVYLRTDSHVARFEFPAWREVPWDYGVERDKPGFDSDGASLIGTLELPAKGRPGWLHLGGMGISPKGHLVVSCFNLTRKEARARPTEYNVSKAVGRVGIGYTPPIFPGRHLFGEVHVWDRHGKVIYEDAIPGLTMTDGVMIDNNDNVYALASKYRMIKGTPYPVKWTETLFKMVPKQGKVITVTSSTDVPLPIEKKALPRRPSDLQRMGSESWIENPEWLYGGVGHGGGEIALCKCWNARSTLDYLGRIFVPEVDHYSVAVLDTNGNLITRVGHYGNVDEGVPLIKKGGPSAPRSIGGDEVALFHAAYVETCTDRRLFISDAGNRRILSVKLGYHAEVKVPLKDVKDGKR